MKSERNYFITTPKGLESLLADEVRELGGKEVKLGQAGVNFSADLKTAYRVCLWSRLGNRVLLPLAQFKAASPEALYDGIQQTDWAEHMSETGTLAVQFNSSNSAITHTLYGALKVKDAIVDQFRDRFDVRPSVDRERPDIRINVYVFRDKARLSLDIAGESLHRRGYRASGAKAPLKENLAAGLLRQAGWPEKFNKHAGLIDPMCGSGTLPIEAAMMSADIAPGLLRSYFGFKGWLQHDEALWQELREEALQRREAGIKHIPPIYGFDRDGRTLASARENVQRIGLQDQIVFERRELDQSRPLPDVEPGLLIINPPYGERLGSEEGVAKLYGQLGKVLKTVFPAWQVSFFTGSPELLYRLRRPVESSGDFYNGALPCKLVQYAPLMVEPVAQAVEEQAAVPMAVTEGNLSSGAQMLLNRLRKNVKNLKRWAKKNSVSCYRLYDADLPEYALAIDLYQSKQLWVHCQEYAPPKSVDAQKAQQRRDEALSVLQLLFELPPQQLIFKTRQRQKGLAQYEKQNNREQFIEVAEGACRFWVNFHDYLDTGLFLDHRLTREMVQGLARGKTVLNLFSYTGSVTVHAAVGGAVETTTVDMSNTYLEWAQRNLELNGFTEEDGHKCVQADCVQWLINQTRAAAVQQYDLIFLDPPTFSNSKRMEQTFDVQRDHVALIGRAAQLLKPNGTLIFSTNYRKFKLECGVLDNLHFEEISRATIPKDFSRNERIHYCWKIQRNSLEV
ncbi:MAG: bifunctional 23S rRNA (guanine(2069)-N(7))-methyltransferase RlmK/23S rRNA (guanine(2445)-N(2))-methyltransferase RlmL [Gammaproteobacteria bacterium]|nr:bifunctional 23S rRNA (guanine(2069)-N(7))-methyltransferase RlmK/23S rRNA (guanine(2445)-N(2))-methyltransferase RlmL [Gammaproteobacteria bacterium]